MNLLSCLRRINSDRWRGEDAGKQFSHFGFPSIHPHVNVCNPVLAHTNSSSTSVRACSTTVSRLPGASLAQ